MVPCQIVFKWQGPHLIWYCMQSLANTNINLTCIIPWVCIYLSCIDCVTSSMFVWLLPVDNDVTAECFFCFWGVCSVPGYWATRQALLNCYHYIVFHSCRWSMLSLCYDACVRSYTCLPCRHILPYPHILSHVVCLPVSLASRSCMLRFVASLSIFCFTWLVW